MQENVLLIAHEEFLRRREQQVVRFASVRARSSGVLGASGIAATLTATIGDNAGYLLGVVGYFFATVYAVKSMSMRTVTGSSPRGLLGRLVGKDTFAARFEVLVDLEQELRRLEDRLDAIGSEVKTALGWFVAGTALTTLVATITALLKMTGGG